MTQTTQGQSEAVLIAPADGAWTWSVVGQSNVVAQGKAADPASAWKTGAFAAGAVDAFFRLRQRRF